MIFQNSEFKLIKKSLPYNLKRESSDKQIFNQIWKKIKSKNYESKLILEIKEKGIIKIENFLNPKELDDIKKIVVYYVISKNDPKVIFQ